MKPIRSLTALVGAGVISIAAADTIQLKDGKTYSGKVLSETADSYTVDLLISPGIRDERVLKKTEVASVTREGPDEKAFVAISDLVPAPDLLTAADYQARMKLAYDFIKSYPTSTLNPKARKVAAELEKEYDAVEAGGVKINGNIVTAAEHQANKFEVDARMIEAGIRAQANALHWTLALRQFANLEKDYQSSASYRELLPLVRKIINRYRTETAELAADFDKRTKERQAGLERMSGDERTETERAITEEIDSSKKRYEAEKREGTKWVTPDPAVKASLDDTVHFADSELKRLDALKLDTIPDGGKAWRDAWSLLHSGTDQKTAATALNAARAAKLPPAYIAELEAAAKPAPKK